MLSTGINTAMDTAATASPAGPASEPETAERDIGVPAQRALKEGGIGRAEHAEHAAELAPRQRENERRDTDRADERGADLENRNPAQIGAGDVHHDERGKQHVIGKALQSRPVRSFRQQPALQHRAQCDDEEHRDECREDGGHQVSPDCPQESAGDPTRPEE